MQGVKDENNVSMTYCPYFLGGSNIRINNFFNDPLK